MNIDQLIDDLIGRKGGCADRHSDKGGPTKWGITEAVTQLAGWRGKMRDLPRDFAVALYRRTYWLRPGSDHVLPELFDARVNMRPAVTTAFLQRALNALNRNGRDFADLPPATRIDDALLTARTAFLKHHAQWQGGAPEGTRGTAERAIPPPRRCAPRQRGLSLRPASQPTGLKVT